MPNTCVDRELTKKLVAMSTLMSGAVKFISRNPPYVQGSLTSSGCRIDRWQPFCPDGRESSCWTLLPSRRLELFEPSRPVAIRAYWRGSCLGRISGHHTHAKFEVNSIQEAATP